MDVSVADVLGGAGEREHAVDALAPAQEQDATPGPPQADAGIDDGVHAGAVDEPEVAQVEDDDASVQARLAQQPVKPCAVAMSSSPVRRTHAASRPSLVHEH